MIRRYFVHLHFFSLKKQWLRLEWFLKVLIFTLLLISLASPIIIDKFDPLNRKGIDIVLSIDASGSMGSSGFDQQSLKSRFEIVQSLAKDFILKRDQDNVGVVMFGDFAFVASPITYEKEIIVQMIDYLSFGMAGQNTAIGEGIAMAVRAFEFSKSDSKVIVLLSDGEHNSGKISPQNAVNLAKEKSIKIYTVAITDEADSALLKHISDESGGEYFKANDSAELEKIYDQIDTLERSNIKSREYLSKEYYFHYVLLFAFAFMLYFLYRRLKS